MEDIYNRLAERLGHADSKYLPKILEYATSPRQAMILEALNKAPEPALTVEQLTCKLGLAEEVIQQEIEELFCKGLAFPRNFWDRREWRLAKSSAQLHESMQTGWKFYPHPQKLHDLWREYDEKERYLILGDEHAALTAPIMRVVPAWEAVSDNPNLQPWEDWREILKEKQIISVVDCPCRRKIRACDRPTEVCMDFDRVAEYNIASGHGRKLSYEEALEILGYAARSGLIHTAINTAKVGLMCNCCSDCCVEFQTSKYCYMPISQFFSKSRFEAKVDTEICDGCQKCIDNCNFDAIVMVKALDSKKLKARVDPELCYGCGCCTMVCEPRAVTMECVRVASHVPMA